ncbi:MAG: biotin/lipoyl-containing protein, partial [Steroidobacteraceae bacterium]
MTRVIDVRVPDMGNFKDVAVIDVLVKPGDRIEPESPLVTLETEKATMDVPSTVGGIVERVAVNKGGKVNAGDVVVAVRSEDGAGEGAAGQARPSEAAAADGDSAGTAASRPPPDRAGGASAVPAGSTDAAAPREPAGARSGRTAAAAAPAAA